MAQRKTGKSSTKTKTAAPAKSKKPSARAAAPQLRVTDSGIKPAAPKSYASVSVTDNRNGTSWDLPVLKGTIGPDVVDVRKLYSDHGLFTYDPGYGATGSTQSAITYIDGEEGILMHRGYRIEELAKNSDFMEVCYLLLEGELPNAKQKSDFRRNITYHTMLHEQIAAFFRGFRRDAHPMAVLVAVVGALSAFYHDSTDIHDPHQRMVASHRLIAKLPTIAAMAYKYSIGQPFVYPHNDLGYMVDKAKALLTPEAIALLRELVPNLTSLSDWQAAKIEETVRQFIEIKGVKLGQVAQPLRAALTGSATSPGLFEVMEVLGQAESLGRIEDASK